MNGKETGTFLPDHRSKQRHDELATIPIQEELRCFSLRIWFTFLASPSLARERSRVLEERPSAGESSWLHRDRENRCPLFLLFSFRPFAFLVSSTAVTSVETSTLKGRYGGQMRGDKGERVKGSGRICRRSRKDRANPRTTRRWTTWRHGRRVVVDLAGRPSGEGEREREETRRGGRREPGEISSRSRFLGTRGPLARLLQSVFARSIFRIRLGSCSFCSTGRASPSWPR